ncbi:RelA/SpoT family protein [Sanyastnella coralliicola]|uniref:RelA/SpoT family protein n=1 Tax=Sanyastnella coralliicola TaxID=3069118 RepID=UPI0027BAF440|nr:bifunctional (p)ppGpp synthetase/guanosine-3',5'-bis(diphosphate) 3'-pyrophosphohydrolase [Longitalea sp. SCSIO 12813]
MLNIDQEAEKKEILRRYRGLLRSAVRSKSTQDKRRIRKAFDIALEAHKEMRRKSGEPYIYHPIAVARICAEEIGLDTTSIVCALLHDTVEDTYITLEDIETLFGSKERMIIDGLTKISGVFDQTSSMQAENFRKMLLTLSDDIRVILIKIADRLHNMRTLGHMAREKQLKIASETLFMYAPLAHRLGLYNIKTELEDLSLKYKEPEQYEEISSKLEKTKAVRTRFINKFTLPIRNALDEAGIEYEIKGRTKSIFSIWNKMQKKRVRFEDIYDVFAIRIILETEIEGEKALAWKVYSMVTDFYQPNPDRLRDWISIPKGNGYESLHTTVMSPTGKWVEVQIRSRRMDDVAEKGFAAHWKYKGGTENAENNLDRWLSQIREVLESAQDDALTFIDDFKLNLFSEEIYIFTPNGDLKTLPKGSTALDFAFNIHSQIGSQCIGAKVNHRLVPLSHELRSGDQVEIITSKKQTPKEDWLNYVVTARARQKIKHALKEEKRKVAGEGKDMLRRKFKNLGVGFLSINITALEKHYNVDSATELYYQIAKGKIDIKKLKGFEVDGGRIIFKKAPIIPPKQADNKVIAPIPGKKDILLIGDEQQRMDYTLARCCNPIPGDDVFGFVTVNGEIKVHRVNCPNATQLLSNYAYRVIKARWASKELNQFEVTVQFSGIDDVGLVQRITNIISSDMHVNMKAISFESNDGIFDGLVRVQVHDTEHLNTLIDKLRNVNGVLTVDRMDPGQAI